MITGNDIDIDLAVYPPFQPNPQTFDIPDVWLASRPLFGVQTWNPLTSSWEYEGGDGPTSIADYWVTSSTTHIINGIVNYTRYTYTGANAAPRGATEIRLKF